MRRLARLPTPCVLALASVLLVIGTGRADPLVSTWGWILHLGSNYFSEADPEPDTWVCHDDVHLVEAGGMPEFHIEITGDCAFLPSNWSSDAPNWQPAWEDVRWRGTYDYETGQGSEELKRTSGGQTLYEVDLQCQPDENPFIHTGSCQVVSASGGPSPDGTRGSPPLSGGRLDGTTRQNLIGWEAAQGQTQEGEGMDLAPNADPPRIVSPTAGGSFANGPMIVLKPSTRGVPLSTQYEVEFFFQKPFASAGGGGVVMRVADTPRVLVQKEPDLVRIVDWSTHPDGLHVPLSEMGRMGHWRIRARMAGVPGNEWTGPVSFTSGIESKTAMPAAEGGFSPLGEKKELGTSRGLQKRSVLQKRNEMRRTNEMRTGPTVGAAPAEEPAASPKASGAGGGLQPLSPSARPQAR